MSLGFARKAGAGKHWMLIQLCAFLVLLGTSFSAFAVDCVADYGGVIDGNVVNPAPSNINIDGNCTIRNFQQPNPLNSNISFYTSPGQTDQRWLVVFDNVDFTQGNIACDAVHQHHIWFVNGSLQQVRPNCQNFLVPVESINKKGPAYAAVGVPFTYRLLIPVLIDPSSGTVVLDGASQNDLHGITLYDNIGFDPVTVYLNGMDDGDPSTPPVLLPTVIPGTGVDMSLVGTPSVRWCTDLSCATLGAPINPNIVVNPNGLIEFHFPSGFVLPKGGRLAIDITTVLNDNPKVNVLGKSFVNTAIWQFGRLIDGTFYTPLPGENGISNPAVIAGPNLVVNKSGSAALGGLNLGQWGDFTVDAVNTGQFNAWNVTLLDRLPDGPTGGMCDMTPQITSVRLGGTALTEGVDYTRTYAAAPTCELSITLLDAAGPIAPGQHLVLDYRSKLDANTQNGVALTNVAGATRWYNDRSSNPARVEVTRTLTNGTVGVDDHEDAHTLTVLLSGFFYEKTVRDLTTGDDPAITAAPGDVLHYTLRLQATKAGFTDAIFRDQLPPDFVPGSLVFTSLPAGAINNSNPATGLIYIRGVNVAAGRDVRVEFNVTLLSTLANRHLVVNQAQLLSNPQTVLADSDDPNVNGQADPDPAVDDEDPTIVRIGAPPSPPTKTLLSPASGEATIGEELVYRIAVPGQPRNSPMYDVQVMDLLNANLEYVSANVSVGGIVNGPGVVNSSTASQLNIAIAQVPAGQQAFVDVRVRVRNVLGAQEGVSVSNTASFTYSESVAGPREPALTTNAVVFNIIEPTVKITKVADRVTAAVNDIVHYTVTLTAASGTNASGAFDVSLTDTLGAGLQYVAGTATVTGTGNTIGAPVVTGDGSNAAPQTLVWSLADGNADIDIAEGESIQISYDVRVLASVMADQNLINTAVARWTGIDGATGVERTGADGAGQLNDYVTNPASTTVTTPGARPSKVVTSPASGKATIGEEVVYTITVPSAPSSSTLYDVAVTDVLDANLELASVNVTGGAIGASSTGSTSTQMNVAVAQIAAGQQATIELHARVRNIPSAQQGVQVNNTVSYTYATSPGGTTAAPLTSAPATFTIVEPTLTVAKTGDKTGVKSGDIVRYTVTLTAAGDPNASDAFDARLVDTLAAGLQYVGNPTVSGTGNTIGAPQISGAGTAASPYVLTWSTAAGNADINVAKGTAVQVSYDVRVQPNIPALTSLTNSVVVDWTGLDGSSTFERTGAGCPAWTAPNDYCTAPATYAVLTDPPRLDFTKTVVSTTPAHPGDVVQYRVQLTNLSGVSAAGISLVDELDALNDPAKFVPGTLTLVGALPAGAVNNTNASGGAKGTGRIDIGNLTLGAAGSGSETVTVEYRVQLVPVIANGTIVLNQARAQFGTMLLQLSDDPSVNGPANPDVSGDEDPTRLPIESAPKLVVEKVSTYLGANPGVLMAGDSLRYTITVRNIGTDNAHGVSLRDLVPANTTYVAGSTTLNGLTVADGANGSPLINGIAINSPAETTVGVVRADNPANAAANVATLTFVVTVDPTAADGTIISNQAFVTGQDVIDEVPSDDPRTPVINDPTRDVVGNSPLMYADKAAALQIDGSSPGVVDPLDTLRYTIRIYNNGKAPATQVVLRDNVPQYTTWVADSLTLNGQPAGRPDGGVSPLIAGLDVGTINPGQVAVVQFDLRVNAGTAAGTRIVNQARVTSAGQPPLLTDGDGNPSTGPEPTVVIVGAAQALTINKQVAVVGGGLALPGAEVEYVVLVHNASPVPATLVRIVDDLTASAPGQLTYVNGSATLNGSNAGISVVGGVITADYSGSHGALASGATATLRFRATIASGLTAGTRITNTAVVNWDDPAQTASASVAFDVGGRVGVGVLSGRAWHDANFNKTPDLGERVLAGWSVGLYRNAQLERSTTTDANGNWQIANVVPNAGSSDALEVRFTAPGANATTAKLGYADSVFSNDLQRIYTIAVQTGSNLLNLNLPIEPNGVIYESMNRGVVPGARLRLMDAAGVSALPASCFADPVQQGQVTQQAGYYRFDMNFADPACPTGGSYVIEVTPPSTNFIAGASALIPPTSDASTAAFSVPSCPAGVSDAVPGTTERCEAQVSERAPSTSVPARSAGTTYYLHLRLDDTSMPGSSQIFNNHIPLDLDLGEALSISKTTPLKNVVRGQLVPYTITLRNLSGLQLRDVRAVDSYPAGFRYVPGSARIDNVASEPTQNGRQLTWSGLAFTTTGDHTITLLLAVGAGVGEGEFVNHARVWNGSTNRPLSGDATATVRVVPDPTFDCTDIIGKVFDDANRNGYQDQGEGGLGGVRVVSARGLAATTDKFGRYHITCAVVPNEDRGSNFVLKLDDRTLPSGYRLSTRQTVIARATRGKALSIDYGASVFRVVSLDLTDEVFEHGGTELRSYWQPRMQTLIDELVKEPAVLRLSYLADLEDPKLVAARLAAIKQKVTEAWPDAGASYELKVEQQTFWRRGAPVQRPAGNQGASK